MWTTKRSTVLVVKTLKAGLHYSFRAATGADQQHLAGTSCVVHV
jgi:hypothetical protein